LSTDKKLTIHGKGESRRNFVHVEDVSRAIDLITKRGKLNEVYNIGSKNEFSVNDIALKLLEIIKPGENLDNWTIPVEDRKFNDFRYAINTTAISNLGWKEEISFEDGLRDTVAWYLKKFQS